MGDRSGNLLRAVACVATAFPEARIRQSSMVRSAAWGYNSPNEFLNMGIALEFVSLPDPQDILHRILAVERGISTDSHRNADGSYRDRIIDIDLIAVDDMVVDTAVLQLPHPRMHKRKFVLEPMVQLAPYWCHPITGLSCAQMITEL